MSEIYKKMGIKSISTNCYQKIKLSNTCSNLSGYRISVSPVNPLVFAQSCTPHSENTKKLSLTFFEYWDGRTRLRFVRKIDFN